MQVAEFAAAHHRVVTLDELRTLGLGSSTAREWSDRGRLRRVHRGVYLYGGGALSQVGRFYAALRAIGKDAVLSYITAAVHHGSWPFDEPGVVHVTVPRQVRSQPGIAVHCVKRLPKESVTIWKGLRVTTPARTAIDLAGAPISDYAFGRSLHEAQVQGMTITQLRAERARMPVRFKGGKRLNAEIDLGPTRTRSNLEEWGVALLRRNGFPPFETNAHPPNTPAWVEVDVYFRRHRLAVEFDGHKYHGTGWRRGRDAEKRKLLRGSGTEVLVLTDEDAAPDREEETVAKIREALLEFG
ncbi:MAG TPA: type IV toxin-antitoxin system AbiEi family antitoxin domain-containing protein [Solirubrobacteraceae bacterium]|nr:type IV toxin-antitoxin system AbiEi family antitoxin domain-containing protein [Solirubrobacteraceae bacterium]